MSNKKKLSFSKTILGWYDKNKRTLPWREETDFYRIWLSEIMLQQTQVKRVSIFYTKWIKKFPTLESVANAKEEHLLKVWEGLGYYNRCRNFYKAAKIIINDYNGKIPNDYQTFRLLPGVGDYTASAVLSIAFGMPYPAIDGNIKRIMARMLGIKKITNFNYKRIKKTLLNLISSSRPGDFNQALMDLGSQVCRPNQAHCYKCPLKLFCKAGNTLNPEKYPRPLSKKNIPHYDVVVGMIWKEGRFLIQKRENQKHLSGLWELPGGKIENNERSELALIREIKEECDFEVIPKKKMESIKHKYSHFSITLTAFHCKIKNSAKVPSKQSTRWITPGEIGDYPFPRANHKLFNQLENFYSNG